MDKETFCKSLYGGDNLSDSDDGADDIAMLLRERRKQVASCPPSSKAAAHNSPFQRPQKSEAAARAQTASPRTTSEDREKVSSMRRNTCTDTTRSEGPSKRPDKKEANLAPAKKPRTDSTSHGQDNRRIFKGLVFFFIPNNDISPARRLRIKRSVEFGACRATEWSGNVTHIVVDRGLTAQDVMKCLKINSLPPNIALVNDVYPVECISNGTVLDAFQQRFQVDASILRQRESAVSAEASEAPSGSLKLKTSRHEKQKISTPRQSQALKTSSPVQAESRNNIEDDGYTSISKSGDHWDALDEVIQDVKTTTALPVDFSDGEDHITSHSDSEGENSKHSRKRRKTAEDTSSWQSSFSCMYKHDGNIGKDNPNEKTVQILQQMLDYYERTGDQWRCLAYRKAVTALRNTKQKISTKDEALSIRGIGERLASKIEEIVWTNRLRRLEYANLEPNDDLLSQFMNVYGAGFAQASKWIAQGYKSLDDVRQRATLTPNQQIGLDHHDDFLQRIPRTEVEAHGDIVRNSIVRNDSDFQVIVGGSYRRGKADSGDIDVIITKDGASLEQINELVTHSVVPDLFEQGFLKADLAVSSRADGSKWHGASALPGNPTWRRIDLLFVPGDELGAALIYFTGNDIFNRSLRLLASKKGMCLNQRGLFADILRRPDRVKLNAGQLLESRDERRIFELLGVPWRPPHHRIC